MRRIEAEFSDYPLIKSPTENLPQDTQQEESSAKGDDL